MDWVLLLREGDENPEARYAIRSWIANAGLGESDRLVIVGYCPTWLAPDLHIVGNAHRSGPLNVWDNVLLACSDMRLTPEVLICNDDQFAIEPTDPTEIVYRMPLAQHIRRLPLQASWWASSLRLTHAYLRSHGVKDAMSYELHRPMLVNRAAMARHLTDAWSGHGFPPQFRTIYGGMEDIGGTPVRDCKVFSRKGDMLGPWISTTDGAWRLGWGEKIMPLFPEPSRYERTEQ